MRILKSVVLTAVLMVLFSPALAQDATVPAEWKSLDVAGLTQLAVDLTGKGQASADQCQKLAKFVAQKFDAASSAGTMQWDQWMGLANLLAAHYPPATRDAMAKSIQEKLFSPQAISKQEAGIIHSAAGAVAALDKPEEAGVIVAKWICASDKYAKAGLDDLYSFSYSICTVLGDDGKNARARLAQFVTQKYCASVQSAKTVILPGWQAFAVGLNTELSPQTKSFWAGKVKEAYGGSELMENPSLFLSMDQTLAVLGDSGLREISLRLMDGKAWESWKPAELYGLAAALSQTGQAGSGARAKLGNSLVAKCMNDPAMFKSLSIEAWAGYATFLGKDVAPNLRKELAGRIKDKYGPGVDQKNTYFSVASTLESLGEIVPEDMTKKWAQSGVWQSWAPGEMLAEGTKLIKAGEGKRLASKFSTFVPDKDISWDQWLYFVAVLTPDFTDDARDAAAKKIQGKFLSSPQASASLDGPMVQGVCGTLDGLGKKKLSAASVAAWIDGRKECNIPVEILWFFTGKACEAGDAGKSARGKLIAYITSTYCQNDESARKLSLSTWRGNVMGLVSEMSLQAKTQWAERVKSAYGDPKALANATDYETLSLTLGQLGVVSTEAATRVMTSGTAWQSWTVPQLTNLAGALAEAGDAGKETRARLYGFITDKYVNDPAKAPLACWNVLAFIGGKELPDQTKVLWSKKLQEAFGPSVDHDKNYLLLSQAVFSLKQQVLPQLTKKWAPSGVWQSWLAGECLPYGRTLKDAGEGKRLASYFEKACASKDFVLKQWLYLVPVVAEDLSPEAKDGLVKKIQEKLLSSPKASALLECYAILDACGALDSLGKKELAAASVAAWINGQKECNIPVGLLWFFTGKVCQAGDAGKSARLKLINYLTSTYCQNDESARKLVLPVWRLSVMHLLSEMTPQVKAQWAERVKSAYGDSRALGAATDYETLSLTLGQLGTAPTEAATKLTTQGTVWQSWDAGQIANLASALFVAGDAGKEARTRLGLFISTKFISTSDAARKVPLPIWNNLVKYLNLELSAEAKSAWAARLMDAYGETTAFKADQWIGLIDSLKQLRKEDVPKAWSKLAEGNAWQSWGAEDLLWLAQQAYDSGQGGKGLREKIGTHITATFAKDQATMRSVPLYFWRGWAYCLGSDLSYQDRSSWAQKLQESFGDSLGSGSSYNNMVMALGSLRSTMSVKLALRWAKSENWQSWKPEEFIALTQVLSATGQSGHQARLRLAEFISNKYMSGAASPAAVDLHIWRELIHCVAEDLTKDTASRWCDKFCDEFAGSDSALKALEGKDLRVLGEVISFLDRNRAAEIVAKWVDSSTKSQATSVDDSIGIGAALAGSVDPQKLKLLNEMDAHWAKWAHQGRLDINQCETILRIWMSHDPQKAKQWARLMYKSLFGGKTQEPVLGELTRVGMWLLDTGQAGKDYSYPEFADAAAGLAGRGKITFDVWFDYAYLAAPLAAPGARKMIQDQLIDGKGCPRIGIGKILAAASLQAGEYKSWAQQVDKKISDSSGNSDAKACWYAIKAYGESLVFGGDPVWLRAKKWLDSALASAESSQTRLAVLQELCAFYVNTSRPAVGLATLRSMEQQFAGEELAMIQDIEARLAELASQFKDKRASDVANANVAAQASLLQYYKRCLATAQSAGQQDKVAKLGTLIQNLESQLDK